MTVEELIEELRTLPQTAIVQVCEQPYDYDNGIPCDITKALYDYGYVTIVFSRDTADAK